jgi:hypothetical protein
MLTGIAAKPSGELIHAGLYSPRVAERPDHETATELRTAADD